MTSSSKEGEKNGLTSLQVIVQVSFSKLNSVESIESEFALLVILVSLLLIPMPLICT